MKESYSISTIIPLDFYSIKKISDDCFGSNYLTINQIQNAIESEGVFLKVSQGDKIIGFSFTFWNHEMEKMKFINPENNTSFGVIKTIAIAPDMQKQGFGSQLIEASINEMISKFESRHFFYLAWTESKSFRFTSKLKRIGFKSIEIIPNYWYDESLKFNYGCLRCGNPPCNCSLTLFKLTT